MVLLVKTNAENQDFINLVAKLDAGLAITDGDEHAFYDQFNQLDDIKYVIVLYKDEKAVGCGAIKKYGSETMEIKRMFVLEECRGLGLASMILKALEVWAMNLGFLRCILETGSRQHEAIGLYHKREYQIIPNYGQYQDVQNSVCFEKKLK